MTGSNEFAEVMRHEARAIEAAASRLDPNGSAAAVRLLLECEGKVVVTGVGKSGLVAQKIAASFTSIGLLSVYLNPLDALHGDIGVVRQHDVVLLVSNSGETAELLAIVPYVKNRGVKLLGIIGRPRSTLTALCDVSLDASVEHEAAPIDHVPTSSTAVAMAIGDALAVSWMTERGISASDFAMNHPGGTIGRRLTLRVVDVMVPLSKLTPISRESQLTEVIDALTTQAIGAVLVRDDANPHALGGIITDGDLRRALRRTPSSSWGSLVAGDLMTVRPICTSPEVLAVDALELMERNSRKSVTVLPVVDHERVVGMLRMHDLVQAGLS